MTLTTTWYSLEEAMEKYGLERREIEGWVEDGLLRAETEGKRVISVHADDLELLIHRRTGI